MASPVKVKKSVEWPAGRQLFRLWFPVYVLPNQNPIQLLSLGFSPNARMVVACLSLSLHEYMGQCLLRLGF